MRHSIPSRSVVAALCLTAGLALVARPASAADLADLASHPLGEGEAFQSVSPGRLEAAAARLRTAIGPLDRLLVRSPSGADWRRYLDWPALTAVAASASTADPVALRRLQKLLDAEENGLEMPAFAAVRRAVTAYAEAAEAARSPQAADVYRQRLDRLAEAVVAGAAAGTTEPFDPVGPLLARLEESGQAANAVARIRGVLTRPNLFLDVDERLLGSVVERPVDDVAPINDTVLGTRVRGSGRTSGRVFLDFVPSADRAVVDLRLAATNHSDTRGSQGPVTVHTLGTTRIDARKRILIDGESVGAERVVAHAATDTQTAGIGVNKRFGQRLIRKIASRKIAEMRPQAERISATKAETRVREQFESQTAAAIAQAASDFQSKFRRPLMERGWYPELLRMSTDDRRLSVVARKSLPDQLGAFSAPPAVDPDAVLAVRLHDSLVNNVGEITLGGRTITQQFVEEQMRKNNSPLADSLGGDPDQPPWSITFAKRRPVELDVDDGRIKVTVRGSRYTSGDREFPAMDVWAAYRVAPGADGIRLIRDGDVQIYPPGFVPGGGEKLSIAQTSLRRILQKRFNKVFQEIIDVEPLVLPGQLAQAGPLPMEQLVARRDGWVAVAWRHRDPGLRAGRVVREASPNAAVALDAPAAALALGGR